MRSSSAFTLALTLTIVLLAIGGQTTTYSTLSQDHRVIENNPVHPRTITATAQEISPVPDAPRTGQGLLVRPHSTPLADPTSLPLQSSAPPANYDEQVGTTFTQNFNSISYNVTALGQSDAQGYGPAYLLNGLTTAGYWYQVGVSYDWPLTAGGYNPGFNLNYNVFNSNQQVVLPLNGGGGLATFSGPVNSGDQVQLSLYFSRGNVIMQGTDVSTGASASVSYSAVRATTFVGSPNTIVDSSGFFTGLMTEWYHVDPYFSDDGGVVYSDPQFGLSSAWMWVDEFNINTFQLLFSNSTSSPVSYSSSPDQSQFFYSNGASESSNAYTFVTGFSPCGITTLSPGVLACNGLGPTTIGLSWQPSNYLLLLNKYLVQESSLGPNGPWTTIDTITSRSNTTDYIQGLTPDTPYWWRIEDAATNGTATTTNILQVRQTNTAILSYTQLSDTNYQLTWGNNANYTGSVAFDSYQLEESVNGSSYAVVYTSSTVSATTTTQILSPDTHYSFYLVTVDHCATCSTPLASRSNSTIITLLTPPALTASAIAGPASPDVGQTAMFTCSAAGGVQPYSYSWTFGDGETGIGQSVAHNYTISGMMSVVCTVVDGLHGTTLGTTSISILPDPSVTVATSSPSAIDLGQTAQLRILASGGSGGYTYRWLSLPPGCSSINAASISCKPTATGTFLVSVNVTDSNGFSVLSTSLSIIVYSGPSITAAYVHPNILDLGQTTSIAISGIGGNGPYSYSYSGLPGCPTANTPVLACTSTETGTFSITGTLTDANGFSVTSNQLRLIVNPDPTAILSISPSATDVNQQITLTVSATLGTGHYSYTYQNLPFGCSTTNSTTLSCSPSTTGRYIVNVVVTDSIGGTATSAFTITINPEPTISSIMSSQSSISVGQQTTLTISTTGGTEPMSYKYTDLPPGCTSTDAATLSCTPSTTGTFLVKATVTDHAGKTATSSVGINVSPENTVLGLAPLVGYSIIGAIIVAVPAVGAAVLLRLRRRKAV